MSDIWSSSLLSIWKSLNGFQMEAFVKQYLMGSFSSMLGCVNNNGMGV
jgi:hypothetical protein